MLRSNKLSRRSAVVGATAFGLSAPFVRGAYAAGKLSVGFWDHWVPNANDATQALVKEWGEKEKVEVQLDFITTQANKLLLTGAAESQAKTGHDILAHTSFLPARYAEQLVPVNDLMDELIKTNGEVNATVEYLGKIGGKWLAIPATVGSQIKGPCSRIDYMKQFAGIDVQALYPAGAPAQGRRLDARRVPQGGRGLPQGRQAVRHRRRQHRRQRRHDRRGVPCLRRPSW